MNNFIGFYNGSLKYIRIVGILGNWRYKKLAYLIAKRLNQSGCLALQTRVGNQMAEFADALQEKLGYDIEIMTISRPTAYGEYEPYHFVNSYDEFEELAMKL